MKEFLRDFWLYFKQLWKNPWWYFLVAMGFFGGAPLMRRLIVTIALAIVFPALGVLYHKYWCDCCREKEKRQ